MSFNYYLRLASKMDLNGKYKESDLIFKLVQASADDFDLNSNPLGIGSENINLHKELYDELREKRDNGLITNDQFLSSLVLLAQEFPSTSDREYDSVQDRLGKLGIVTFGRDRDVIREIYNYSDEISLGWLQDLEADAYYYLRSNGIDLNSFEHAGDNLMFLAQGQIVNNINIDDLIKGITDFNSFDSYFSEYLNSKVPEMAGKLESCATDAPYYKRISVNPEEIYSKINSAGIRFDNVNNVLEEILLEIFFKKIR